MNKLRRTATKSLVAVRGHDETSLQSLRWCGLDPHNWNGNQAAVEFVAALAALAAEPAGPGSAAQSLVAALAAAGLAAVLESDLVRSAAVRAAVLVLRRPCSSL